MKRTTPLRYSSFNDVSKPYIRLIELLPGLKTEPLEAIIRTVDLATNPDYDALSYVWGDPKPYSKLIVNQIHFVLLAENLSNALLSLRNAKESRILWVDAVCINQDDMAERGHQVNLMRRIYSNATSLRLGQLEGLNYPLP
ncbi:HET-domain-containing protein [Thozetella sp. PMI_491]|nr:HET-domain-containing protein [Thozetella sp. PMI_491]